VGDIGGHRRQVNLEFRQVSRVAVQPTDPLRTGLSAGYVQRCRRRVHPDNLDATIGKQAGEAACAAADIQHATGTEFGSDRHVVIEIVTLFLHKVVDLGEPRQGEKGISHKIRLRSRGSQRGPTDQSPPARIKVASGIRLCRTFGGDGS
jgi:hypothetical protein